MGLVEDVLEDDPAGSVRTTSTVHGTVVGFGSLDGKKWGKTEEEARK